MTESIFTISDPFRVTLEDHATGMALPAATLTKVYVHFKLLGFGYANANKDGFLAADVTDEAVATLVGSPVYADRGLGGHPNADARATERAPYQIGTVVGAEKTIDGVFCVAAIMRDWFGALDINPNDLPAIFSVSMETTFDRTKSKYKVGEQIMSWHDAREAGIASPIGLPDNRENYDARYIIPKDYHGVAMLMKGRNADPQAEFQRIAAARHVEVNTEEDLW